MRSSGFVLVKSFVLIIMFVLIINLVQEQVENMLYARLISINSPHFDFNACVFSEKAMESKV